MAANQIDYFSSVIEFLIAEKWKTCEIYRRVCGVYGEECFNQKMSRKGLNGSLLSWDCVEKTVHGEETQSDFPVKKMFWA